MKSVGVNIAAGLGLALVVGGAPTAASAATWIVSPGQSIQDAIDGAAAGDTVKVLPGDYTETHGGTAAVRITKRLKLIAKSKLKSTPPVKVRILPGVGNQHGIVVEPVNPGVDPDVEKVTVKGFTVEGFPKHGIWLRHVYDFKIDSNESIDNLENGIFPTLSAKGLVKKNVSYGSEDSALWVEASENVRVIKNDLSYAPTGLEVTVSKNLQIKKNNVHHNTIGIGLYHPDAASLPPLGGDGDWDVVGNWVHDNNEPNSAPPGSMAAELPKGGGILVLGVDNVVLAKNTIENNGFFGIGLIDWCVAVDGSAFDCDTNPPQVESAVDNIQVIKNKLVGNATVVQSNGFFELIRADITHLPQGTNNCYEANTYTSQFPPSPFTLPACP